MERRKLLKYCPIIFGVSGCLRESGDGYKISSVRLVNTDTEPHNFQIVIVSDGNVLHWFSETVKAAKKDTELHASSTELGIRIEKEGTYSVHARVDERESFRSLTADEIETEGCISLQVQYNRDDRIGVFYSTSCQNN